MRWLLVQVTVRVAFSVLVRRLAGLGIWYGDEKDRNTNSYRGSCVKYNIDLNLQIEYV